MSTEDPDKLALSILVFGVITYFTLEGLTNSNAKVDFDRTFRIGLLLLGTVLLLEIGGLSQKLDHAIEVTVDGSVSVDGSALSSDPIKVEVER
jgi:hypothetical protein